MDGTHLRVNAFVNAFVDAFVNAFVDAFVNAFVDAFVNGFRWHCIPPAHDSKFGSSAIHTTP